MIDNTENKKDNFHLQECSLKNRPFCKLAISQETYPFLMTMMKQTVTSGLCYIKDLIFLESDIV